MIFKEDIEIRNATYYQRPFYTIMLLPIFERGGEIGQCISICFKFLLIINKFFFDIPFKTILTLDNLAKLITNHTSGPG